MATIGRPRENRLPIEPLLDAYQIRSISHLHEHNRYNVTVVAEVLGVHRTSVMCAIRDGVTLVRADRWACKLGFHPLAIWGDDYFMKERAA